MYQKHGTIHWNGAMTLEYERVEGQCKSYIIKTPTKLLCTKVFWKNYLFTWVSETVYGDLKGDF